MRPTRRRRLHLLFALVLLMVTLLVSPLRASGPVTGTYKVLIIRTTYSDDTAVTSSLSNLELAGKEIHHFFYELSFGNLYLEVFVGHADLTQPLSHYWSACPSSDDPNKWCISGPLMADAAEAAGANGADFTGINAVVVLSPCGVHDNYDNVTYGSDANLNSAHAHATVHQIYDTDCPNTDPTHFPPLGPSGVSWGGWAHEIGHSLQLEGHDMFSHPGGYSSGYDLMDSCYPCGETVYSLSGNPVVANEQDTSFPGWLPSSKTVIIPKPSTGTAGGTYVLEPVNKPKPTTTVAPRGIKLPLDGDRSIFVEARTAVGADDRPWGIQDEGVHLYMAQESADDGHGHPKPLTMLDSCQTTVAGGCVYSQSDPRFPTCPNNAPNMSYSQPYCWPFLLWHPGDTFNDPVDAIMVHVNGKVGDGYGVTVTRNVPPGHPDPFLYPWLTAPMNTYETVDIWVDSSCNGYESDVGLAGLRYGRRGDGTVVGNGDDPCANHENRIYAHIRNGGSVPANNVTVFFEASNPLGMGMTGSWTVVGSALIPTIPAGGERDVYVTWTPHVTLSESEIQSGHFNFHSCVRVHIAPVAGELVTSNNDAQENFDHFEAVQDPYSHVYTVPDRFFYVANNYGMAHGDVAGAPGKLPSDFSKPIQLRIKSELPPGWSYAVNGGVNEFTLAPHEVRQIPVKIKVPPGTPTAQTFNLRVTAFAQHHTINPAVAPSSPHSWHFGWMQENGVVEGVLTVDPSKLTLTAEFHCPDTSRPAAAVPPSQIVVKGKLDPAHNNVIIAIDYTPPGGAPTVTHLVHTDASGQFQDTLNNPAQGVWQVRALWQGDMDHSGSVSDLQKVEVGRCETKPAQPQTAPPGSTVLVPNGAFPGGVLTGVVLGPDDKPVPNTPVNIAGGVPITLTGVVVGEEEPSKPQPPARPQPCQPDAAGNLPPGCPPAPTRPRPPARQMPCQPDAAGNLPAGCAPPTVSLPSDCAAVLQQFAGTAATQAVPAPPAGAAPTAIGGTTGGTPQFLTDANGRFAMCVPVDAPKVDVALPGAPPQSVPGIRDVKERGARRQPPTFFQPNDRVNLIGLLRDPAMEQGGQTWQLPAVQAISPDGRQTLTAFKTPRDLVPGPVKFSFTDPSGRREFTGGVFKILSATLDRSKLRSQEGADFEYTVQFGDGSTHACVEVTVAGPVVLVQAPPPEIPVDANGVGKFGGKIRATQVAPGAAIPFDIVPDISQCGGGPQSTPQGGEKQPGSQGAPSLYTGTTLVNPWGKQGLQGPITAPAPTAIKPAAPGSGVSTGPSHTMDETTKAGAHEQAPPPFYMCDPKLTTPAIGNVTNSHMPPGTFTQEPGKNDYVIHGCNFGDTPGHVYLIFPPASGQPGFGIPVELFQASPWKSDLLEVVLDQNFGGYLDSDGLILQVVTAKGVKAELPNRKFSAWRVGTTIQWMPASQVKLGSAGSNWITAVFKPYAPSQTQSVLTIEQVQSSEPQTATVSRSITNVGGPFTVQDDLWDFSALQPGFTVTDATPFYDSFTGAGCDQTSGHWGTYWDSATLLRVHVQGCYHKGTGNFSSSTSFYGLTVRLIGPKGALPWPATLK